MRPIEKKHLTQMSTIMPVLTKFFPGYCISLMVFKPESPDRRRIHYVCNTDKTFLISALKEFIARHEAQP